MCMSGSCSGRVVVVSRPMLCSDVPDYALVVFLKSWSCCVVLSTSCSSHAIAKLPALEVYGVNLF